MKIEFRITSQLLRQTHEKLSLRYPFAAERVGFISCGVARIPENKLLLLGESFLTVNDADYIDNPNFGAL